MIVTIVGGGASGILLAINLMRKSSKKITINIIEKDKENFITGIAYSTKELCHLLNVRASGMSLFSEDGEHFYNWLISNGYTYTKDDFVPRMIFGKYLKDTYHLLKTITNSETNEIFDECINIDIDNSEVILKSGTKVKSDKIVLALGHISPSETNTLRNIDYSKYHRSPWNSDLYDKIEKDEDILLIGSGLTADDITLSLISKGHSGKIYSISRNGKQPIIHQHYEKYSSFFEEIRDKDVNTVFSIVKEHIKRSKNPLGVIDSLRPHNQIIWQQFSKNDKERFLRHINPLWNTIRHRKPTQNGERLQELVDKGQLIYLKGRISDFAISDNIIRIEYQTKEYIKNLSVNTIINCIGPESSYKRIEMPLLKNLFSSGVIRSNESDMSISVKNWRVISNNSISQENLYAIGPLLKGELFESTAIPEIRVQAEKLSEVIL